MNVRALLACVAALAIVACGGEMTDPDSGTPRDAGRTPDAGGGDAGGGTDAGRGMDAGGADDAGGGDDAGSMPDAGPTDGGHIGACTPAPIMVVETCPTFTACGGDLVDTWCYTGLCVEESEIFDGTAGCSADSVELRGFNGTVTGRVDVTATNVTREITSHVEGTIVLPPGLCSGFGNCATVETFINNELGSDGMATCTARADMGCDCDVTIDTMLDSAGTYTNDGSGEITVMDSGGGRTRTYDYCVETDGSLRLRETGTMATEPGIQSLMPEP